PRSRGTQFLGGRTAAPTSRKTDRETNAGSSPKKSAKQKNNLTKFHPRDKSHHGAADAPHPRRSNSRSTPQENKSRNECGFTTKKSTNKKNNITKIQSTRKIPPRSRGCTASSAAEQPLQPAGKQVAQRMQVHHQKIPQTKKTTSPKFHPRAKSPPRSRGCTASSADHSRSNPQEN
ncbi:hypothetical protein TresaDRAFT_2838, partial [Treponema saccharophilum DSM 2985]